MKREYFQLFFTAYVYHLTLFHAYCPKKLLQTITNTKNIGKITSLFNNKEKRQN